MHINLKDLFFNFEQEARCAYGICRRTQERRLFEDKFTEKQSLSDAITTIENTLLDIHNNANRLTPTCTILRTSGREFLSTILTLFKKSLGILSYPQKDSQLFPINHVPLGGTRSVPFLSFAFGYMVAGA
jgi:hypothetical protein